MAGPETRLLIGGERVAGAGEAIEVGLTSIGEVDVSLDLFV